MHYPGFAAGAGLYVEVRTAVGMSSCSSALCRIGGQRRLEILVRNRDRTRVVGA
jgi:hypothetical protein